MEKSQKIMLAIAGGLVIAFAVVLFQDWQGFQQSLPKIMIREQVDPDQAKWMFFSVVVYRGVLFLVPAFILSVFALVLYWKDNQRPKQKRTAS